MAARRSNLKWACAALALGFAFPASAQSGPEGAQTAPDLALMGTVPIYWGEAADFLDLIRAKHRSHWARAQLEREYHLVPLDYLDAAALALHARLLLAQPRGFSAEENIALDAWVRGGGRLLLFADPMMTGETRFGIGDRRRPQDVALLSPILTHWGLRLEFDDGQQAGISVRQIAGHDVPINLAGRLVLVEDEPGAAGKCGLEGGGVLASCTLGEGRITVLADAAMLDLDGPLPAAETALIHLMQRAFAENGDITGIGESERPPCAENGGNPGNLLLNGASELGFESPT